MGVGGIGAGSSWDRCGADEAGGGGDAWGAGSAESLRDALVSNATLRRCALQLTHVVYVR